MKLDTGGTLLPPPVTVMVWVVLLVAPWLSVTVSVSVNVRADGKVRENDDAVETEVPAAMVQLYEAMVPSGSLEPAPLKVHDRPVHDQVKLATGGWLTGPPPPMN